MWLFLPFFIIITILYAILILIYYYNWKKLVETSSNNKITDISVDVIIPFRNEEKNITCLIEYLTKQAYPKDKVQYFLIDDHSGDKSLILLNQLVANKRNFKILVLDERESGKKAALKKGLSASNAEVIVFSDADCIHPSEWLVSMVSSYVTENAHVVLGPVVFDKSKSFFGRFSELEFAGFTGVAAASAYIGKPVMSNGANFLVKREILTGGNDIFNERFASGDDMFLLSELKKKNDYKIVFQKSPKAIVMTNPPENIKFFFSQRIRWVSKNKKLNDKDILVNSFMVFFCNFSLLLCLCLSLVNIYFIYFFIILFLIKTWVDSVFLYPLLKYTGKLELFKFIGVFQFFNLIYIPFVAFFGNISNFQWKGRIYKK